MTTNLAPFVWSPDTMISLLVTDFSQLIKININLAKVYGGARLHSA